MKALDQLRETIGEAAKDTKLNLSSVLGPSSLSVEQRWGTAVACAAASRNRLLLEAALADAAAEVRPEVIEDAKAAASLMAMNNVYYRFRHMVAKPSYATKRAGLRMNRIMRPATSKVDFELFCLAVSAINGCEVCIQAHEKTVTAEGLSEDQVNDAVRIAAVIEATAVALELAAVERGSAGSE